MRNTVSTHFLSLAPLQLLGKIYQMSSRPVFLGARLAGLPPRSQERSVSTEDGVECVLQEFDDDTGQLLSLLPRTLFHALSGRFPSRCGSAPLPGLIQVWILLLEQLTAAVSTCPRQHQPPTLELLFALLREVAVVPGDDL